MQVAAQAFLARVVLWVFCLPIPAQEPVRRKLPVLSSSWEPPSRQIIVLYPKMLQTELTTCPEGFGQGELYICFILFLLVLLKFCFESYYVAPADLELLASLPYSPSCRGPRHRPPTELRSYLQDACLWGTTVRYPCEVSDFLLAPNEAGMQPHTKQTLKNCFLWKTLTLLLRPWGKRHNVNLTSLPSFCISSPWLWVRFQSVLAYGHSNYARTCVSGNGDAEFITLSLNTGGRRYQSCPRPEITLNSRNFSKAGQSIEGNYLSWSSCLGQQRDFSKLR